MLTVYAPRAVLKCHLHQDSASSQQPYSYPCKINNNVHLVNCNPKPFGTPCTNISFHSSSFSGKCDKLQKSLHLFHHVATHKWLVTMLAGSFTCVVQFIYQLSLLSLIHFFLPYYSVDYRIPFHLMMSIVLHATQPSACSGDTGTSLIVVEPTI